MPIIPILITLVIIGVLLWGVQAIPMNETIKRLVVVLAIVATLLWLLGQLTGYGPTLYWGSHRR
jgi:uncharacterized membrane protein YwzB